MIARFSGKPDIAEAAIKAIVEINRDHLASRDASEVRQHEAIMALVDALRAGIAGQQRPVEQFAAPIGPSVERAMLYTSPMRSVPLELSDAEAIRDTAKLSWGPLEQLTLRTDGFRFHTNGLSIENPEHSGFLMARVRDPRFDETENPYTEAAQRRAEIVVLCRRGYKGSDLAGIDIVDFIRDIPT